MIVKTVDNELRGYYFLPIVLPITDEVEIELSGVSVVVGGVG